jgi:FkbM family methyltransferase
MTLRAWLRDWLAARGYVWFRKPKLPWGLDLPSDLERWFDLAAFTCVVDVGAHVGELSLQFAKLCPRAEVVAFEMMPSTFEQLKRNVSAVERIHPHCLGLSDAHDTVTLRVEQESDKNSLRNRVMSPDNEQTVTVELQRLDDVSAALGITAVDLLKVDAEGFDLQVMKGAIKLFQAGRVRVVLVEVDFGNSSIVHGNFAEIAAWLAQWSLWPVGFYDTLILERQGVPYLDYTNVLFVRQAPPAAARR